MGAFKGSEENEHKLTTGRLKFINVKTIWTPNWKMNWFLLLLGATDPLKLKIMTPATTHFLELFKAILSSDYEFSDCAARSEAGQVRKSKECVIIIT